MIGLISIKRKTHHYVVLMQDRDCYYLSRTKNTSLYYLQYSTLTIELLYTSTSIKYTFDLFRAKEPILRKNKSKSISAENCLGSK